MFNRFKLKYNEHKRKYYFFSFFWKLFCSVSSLIWLKNARFLTFALKLTSCFNYAILITVQLADIHAISPSRRIQEITVWHTCSTYHRFRNYGYFILMTGQVSISLYGSESFVCGPTLQRVCSLFYIRYAAQIIWRKVKSTDFRPF